MSIFVLLNTNGDKSKPGDGFHNLHSVVMAVSLLAIFHTAALSYPQDISGGAGEAVKRPADNTTRRRPKSTTQPKPTKRATKSNPATSQAKADLNKQVDAALELGNTARDSNPPRYADAEQAYRLAMGLDPQDPRAYVGLGNTFFDQKRYQEAEAAFVRASELDPENSDALIALAYANNAQEHYDEAERTALRAIALDANSYPAYVALGWSKYQRKNFKEAEIAYRRAIAISPKTPEIYGELGAVLMADKRWADSEPVLLQAVSLNPTNVLLVADYAFVLHKLGQLDKASEIYAKAISLDSKATAPHSNLALIQYARGDFSRAREEWNTAIQLNSTYALDRVGLMILDRKFADAQMELEKYTQANATDEDGWLLLGDVRRMQRDQAGASTAYSRAMQIAPLYAQHPRPTIPEPVAAPESSAKVVKPSQQSANAAPAIIQPTADSSNQNGSSTEPKLRFASSVRRVNATYNARPTPASGSISVTCRPNALVVIEPVGGGEAQMSVVPASVTVVAFNQLRPGEYLVSASLDGYETLETRVFVSVMKIISVKLTLRPRS